MARMAELLPADREVMGKRRREKVEREFDEQIVIDKYLAAIEAVVVNSEIGGDR